jgi:hypothetical protein
MTSTPLFFLMASSFRGRGVPRPRPLGEGRVGDYSPTRTVRPRETPRKYSGLRRVSRAAPRAFR